MQALTEKHRTERIRLTFTGPANRRSRAVANLNRIGFALEGETGEGAVPWQDLFPDELHNLPGTVLVGARAKEGLTQVALSARTGIPQRHISEIENGKRTIGKERARRLADALNIPYQVLL